MKRTRVACEALPYSAPRRLLFIVLTGLTASGCHSADRFESRSAASHSPTSYAATAVGGHGQGGFALEIKPTAQQLVDQSDSILVVEVLEQRGILREDHNGKHIYTEIVLKPLDVLHGDASRINAPQFSVEVIGGTYQGCREEVSYSPTFTQSEKCVVFLEANPWRIVASRHGKKAILDNKFLIDGYRVTPHAFSEALRRYDIEKASDKPLGQLIQEAGGELIESSPREHPQPQSNPPSAPEATPVAEDNLRGSPHDLGGGQLPHSEVREVDKEVPK